MLIVIVRTLILFTLVTIALRVMGKREIGQLQPYELVIIIMLSELAAIPMGHTGIPLLNGITPIVTLIMAQVTLSFISLKSNRARAIICGRPSILIENGKIVESELKRLRYNLSDLMEQLRVKNIPNIADVEFAVLETSGELSVIPKSQKRPLTPEDLKLKTHYEGLPYTLIMDGSILYNNLKKIGLSEAWLKNELAKFGIDDFKKVFIANIDSQGRIYFQTKDTEGN